MAPYAEFIATYNGLLGASLLLARNKGRLPERLAPGDIALLGVAAFRLARLLTRDRVTSLLRSPFTRYRKPGWIPAELDEDPRGKGLQLALGELVSCPYCLSQWTGLVLLAGFMFMPRASRVFAGLLTSVALADFLNMAYQLATGASDVLEEASQQGAS